MALASKKDNPVQNSKLVETMAALQAVVFEQEVGFEDSVGRRFSYDHLSTARGGSIHFTTEPFDRAYKTKAFPELGAMSYELSHVKRDVSMAAHSWLGMHAMYMSRVSGWRKQQASSQKASKMMYLNSNAWKFRLKKIYTSTFLSIPTILGALPIV